MHGVPGEALALIEKFLNVVGGDLVQRLLPEGGIQVRLEVAFIAFQSRRLQDGLFVGPHPLLGIRVEGGNVVAL